MGKYAVVMVYLDGKTKVLLFETSGDAEEAADAAWESRENTNLIDIAVYKRANL